jgi:hypothetical protein
MIKANPFRTDPEYLVTRPTKIPPVALTHMGTKVDADQPTHQPCVWARTRSGEARTKHNKQMLKAMDTIDICNVKNNELWNGFCCRTFCVHAPAKPEIKLAANTGTTPMTHRRFRIDDEEEEEVEEEIDVFSSWATVVLREVGDEAASFTETEDNSTMLVFGLLSDKKGTRMMDSITNADNSKMHNATIWIADCRCWIRI